MSSTININTLFGKNKFKLQVFLNLPEMMPSLVPIVYQRHWCAAAVWSINVKVKPATECQRLPLQAHFSWKEQWQRTIEKNPDSCWKEEATKSNVPWNEYGKHSSAKYLTRLWISLRKMLSFYYVWPLSQVQPGRAWAHLTSPPQCNTGAGSFNEAWTECGEVSWYSGGSGCFRVPVVISVSRYFLLDLRKLHQL